MAEDGLAAAAAAAVTAFERVHGGPGVAATGEMRTNPALFERAIAVMPGGVNSPVRSFRSVGGTPYFVARAEGAYVWDVEGRRYLDYVQSYGASIVGHAHPQVIEAIREAALEGTTFGAPTEREVLLAEILCDRVPGLDMVRLVSSGTEAVMSAVRLARGATGRSKIVKFAGCYHGHSDSLLAAGGSGVANQGLSGSAGVPASAVADTVVAPYNVVPALDDDVAVVVVEPVAANMGLVLPLDGFLAGLRAECDRVGALLLFDEVITGFRLAPGGAAAYFGVRPDLWTFGKVIGGGLPLAAFGGRRDVMEELAPLGPVYQAGTLSGNPLATAAGLAVLHLLDDAAYRMLAGRAEHLAKTLPGVILEAGWDIQVPQIGPLLGLFFSATAVTNYDEAVAAASNGRYARFFHAMLDRGVALAPGAYEAMFPSLAHAYSDLDRTVDIASAAAHAAAAT
jgi:glutamate-1-semialdehyde 2,1-aminomutase